MTNLRALFLSCCLPLAAAAQDAGTPVGPPPPAKELADAMKPFDGSWKCTGKVNDSPFGKGHPYVGTVSQKAELGGHWYVARLDEKKTKESPMPFAMIMTVGWDAEAKGLKRSDIDSFGGVGTSTSKGWEGDKIVWEGSGTMGPEKIQFKDTATKKSAKEMHWATEVNGAVIVEMTCKK